MKRIKKETSCTRVLMAYVQLATLLSCGGKRPKNNPPQISTRMLVVLSGVILTLILISTTVHALGIAPAQVKIPQEANFTKQVSGLIVNNERISRTVQIEVDDPHNLLVDIQKEIIFTADEEQKPFKYKLQLPKSNIPTGTVARIRIHDVQTSTSQVQASITLEVPIIIQGAEAPTTNSGATTQHTQSEEPLSTDTVSAKPARTKQIIIAKTPSTSTAATPPTTQELTEPTTSAVSSEKTVPSSGSITLSSLILLGWIVAFVCYIRYKKDQ